MQFSLSPEPAGVECFLSETSQDDGNVSRKFCKFLEKSDRFKLQDRNFLRQYAHLYSERLMTMRPKLTEAAKNKWGMFRIHVIPPSSSGRLQEMSRKIGKNSSKMHPFFNKNSKSP